MLDKFRAAKQTEISLLHAMQLDGRIPEPLEGVRPGFAAALLSEKEIAVIAEYKRASPSRGAINMNAAPAKVALAYAKAGASAPRLFHARTRPATGPRRLLRTPRAARHFSPPDS